MTKIEQANPDVTQTLWKNYQDSHDFLVRNELVLQYSYIVKCIALKTVGRYQYFNYMDDIINEGIIALLDAVEKFDPEKHVKFETFASIKVRGAMIDYIRRQDCFPRRLKRIAKNIKEADDALSHKLGRTPTDKDLAEYLNVSISEFQKMESETCVLNMLSFEGIIYQKGLEDLTLHFTNDNIQGPEQVVSKKELDSVLIDNIKNLNEKEQLVIALYYKEQLKIREISSIMEISDSRVSQIHSSALRKLKKNMDSYINL